MDTQCTFYVYDKDLKKDLGLNNHDGKRRCRKKVYKNWLCKYHYNKSKVKEVS